MLGTILKIFLSLCLEIGSTWFCLPNPKTCTTEFNFLLSFFLFWFLILINWKLHGNFLICFSLLFDQVNNAAIVTLKDAKDYTHEDFSTIITTNLESPYHLSQLAHPLLKSSGVASIVFNSSVAGLIALPKLAVYSAAKGKGPYIW